MFDPSASRTSFAILTDACSRGKVAPPKCKVKEAQRFPILESDFRDRWSGFLEREHGHH